MLEIRLNGEPRTVPDGATVQDLLRSLGLQDTQVAVERNREIVSRARRESTLLQAGDVLEIVTFVGGG